MRRAQEQPTSPKQNVAEISRPTGAEKPAAAESPVTQKEMTQLRQEKLDSIRLAIARGDYDSDELLQKSMDLLLQRLEQPEHLTGR